MGGELDLSLALPPRPPYSSSSVAPSWQLSILLPPRSPPSYGEESLPGPQFTEPHSHKLPSAPQSPTTEMAPWQLLLLLLLDSALSVMEDKESDDEKEEEDTCLSSPCGLRARCKNLEGSGRFLCTCDPMSQYYHGNPYTACVICTTDAHCQVVRSCSASCCVLIWLLLIQSQYGDF